MNCEQVTVSSEDNCLFLLHEFSISGGTQNQSQHDVCIAFTHRIPRTTSRTLPSGFQRCPSDVRY